MIDRRRFSMFMLASGSLLLSACAPATPPTASENSIGLDQTEFPKPQPPADPAEATIDGNVVHRSELVPPLIEAYGLSMLLKLVELDLARIQASRMGLSVSQADISNETQRYLDEVFKDDKRLGDMRDEVDQKTRAGKIAEAAQTQRAIGVEQNRLLVQLLDNKKLTRTEFDLAMQTNAYLRAIVRPAVEAKLTDDNLQESFRARYGEKVQVRHIALGNMQEVADAKRKLAEGEPFAQVASEMSRNLQTKPLGGELPPFSRMTPGYPQVFKDTSFALQKTGDVSDVVQAEGSFHLIQLMGRIPPTAVKFEDVRDSVKQDLSETLTQASVRDLRAQLGQLALKDLQIQDPILREQFQSKISQQDNELHDRQAIRDALKSERPAATAPAMEPARPAPASPAATVPTTTLSTTGP